MQEGYKHVTQADVAALAGVSRGLVSLVLRGEGRVSEHTRDKILEAAQKLAYQPNLAAAQLAVNKSHFIFLLVPNFENPFFNEVAQGLQQAASERGLTLVMASSGGSAEEERQALERVYQIRPAGVVIAWPFSDDKTLEAYARHTSLCVLTQNRNTRRVACVYMDEIQAAQLIVEHFQQQGVQKICFINPASGVEEYVNDLREKAVEKAALSAGIDFSTGRYQIPAEEFLVELLAMKSGLIGIVAYNDFLAIRIKAGLKDLENKYRRALVVSYDDTFLSKVPEISLSSISQNPVLMGEKCLSLLTHTENEQTNTVILSPDLHIRRSSAIR